MVLNNQWRHVPCCPSLPPFPTTLAVASPPLRFDSYEEIGALCLSDITTSAKNTLESTISTFDTHCAAGSGQCKIEDRSRVNI